MNVRIKSALIITCIFLLSRTNGQVNVYDTLLHIPVFDDHLHHDKKENYTIDKNGILKREFHLLDGSLHYFQWFEDTLYVTLKKLYPHQFRGFRYVAMENVDWKIPGGSFRLKKGKTAEGNKTKMILTTEAELKEKIKRPAWLQKEDDKHFFYRHYFLIDSTDSTVYSFNELTGAPAGVIKYGSNGSVVLETATYANGKPFYELNADSLDVFDPAGGKIFHRTKDEISGTLNGASWTYSLETKKARVGDKAAETFDIEKLYYNVLFTLLMNHN